jgi:translocator protein
MNTPAIIALAVFIALNLAAAASGAVFRPGDWYASLDKPSWVPPNWAFPLVWSVLYAMITASGWLVWQQAGWSALPALSIYVLSLVLNAAWSGLFFGQRRMDLAMIDVVLLWLSIAAVIALFWPIRALAALLLVPYLAWVTVASALNLRMIQLNGTRAATSA